jgi:hypothetical protein
MIQSLYRSNSSSNRSIDLLTRENSSSHDLFAISAIVRAEEPLGVLNRKKNNNVNNEMMNGPKNFFYR